MLAADESTDAGGKGAAGRFGASDERAAPDAESRTSGQDPHLTRGPAPQAWARTSCEDSTLARRPPQAKTDRTRMPNRSRSARRAASQPDMPCTPGPGGVDAEHR